MIQITCTQCKTVLTIDDAFAGGVCRCRHCGTIQTVPKHLKDQAGLNDGGGGSGGVATQVATTKAQKTLYRKKNANDGGGSSGTGLDDLANIVSSGLTGNRLHKKTGGSSGSAPDSNGPASGKKEIPPNRKTMVIVAVSGAVIGLLVGVIIFMSTRDKGADGVAAAHVDPTPDVKPKKVIVESDSNPQRPVAPSNILTFKGVSSFLGQPIGEKSVAYVIDCGQASRLEGKFDLLRRAVGRSLQTLGEGKRFQVIFWSQEGKIMAFPKDSTIAATPKAVADCQKFLDNVESGGLTMAGPALEKAFKNKPEAVILVPVKADLDDGFVMGVLKRRTDAKSSAKYYTFSINQPELAGPLKKIAGDSKGVHKEVSMQELQSGG